MSTPEQDVAAQFRLALRAVASTVMVLTVNHRDGRMGMTATAVTPVSMEPPALLMCVNRSGSVYAALREVDAVCVNVLGVGHAAVSEAFSCAPNGEERFAVGRWESGWHGLPFLADAQANLFVQIDERITYGTHDILIGIVQQVRRARTIEPLLYVDGGVSRLRSRDE